MTLRFKVVIPARYASTRLPGKPLLAIAGLPMIIHVCNKAQQSGAEEVVVATDDDRIYQTVTEWGFRAMMTRPDHQSGTERIAEVAEQCGWALNEIIVNVQGDEPLIPPDIIKDLALALSEQQQAGIATLAAKIQDKAEIFNPNAVKVVFNKDGFALYFSRAPIPWYRDGFANEAPKIPDNIIFHRHIGLYAYTVDFLKRYCQWEPSVLESIESLEQLRILWYGEAIRVKVVDQTPVAGVDTQADLIRVAKALSGQG